MNLTTVIAEKPDVAKSLARHLNANARHDGYYEGNGYQVTWTYGHLVQLASPQEYDWEPSIESIPYFPDPFILKGPSEASALKQLNVIKKLFKSSQEIVVATDAGREGELIFRYVYHYLGCNVPFKRLWISSMTTEAIAQGWKALVDGAQYDSLYYSAKARREADWIIGLNASMALTRSSHSISALSLGRVQTPILAMICSRYLENKEFSSITFFTPQLQLDLLGQTVKIKYNGEMLTERQKAEALLELMGEQVECLDFKKTANQPKQPLLYDLTLLQRFANKKHGFTAKQTLSALQRLYEMKLVTYPRTDSKYISEDIFKTIPDILTTLKGLPFINVTSQSFVLDNLPRVSVDDNKITDHHAIIPTGVTPDQLDKPLSQDEAAIYELIVRRTFAAFGPTCLKEVVKAKFNHDFSFSASKIIEPGWQLFETDADDQEENSMADLPEFNAGQRYSIIHREVAEGETKPRPLYTDNTLLNAMETCGKDLDDETLRQALKGKGIGTAATRADVLEVLVQRDYISREGKKLIPSSLGLDIYKAVANLSISSPELTGEWEAQLTGIAAGELEAQKFLNQISTYCKQLIPQVIAAGPTIRTGSDLDLLCPKCKEHQLKESKFSFRCTGDSCDFSLNKTIASKKLSNNHITDLVRKGKTALISGFHKRNNSGTFNAYLIIDDNGEVQFKFKEYNKASEHCCPSCKAEGVVINDYGAFCNGCNLKIFRKISGKRLSDQHLIQLLKEGQTKLIKGFKYKSGKGSFDARIKLEEGKTIFTK